MGKIITIPDEISIAIKDNDVEVDMSDLRFDLSDEKKKLYAFIFLRNTGMNIKMNFDKCSFEDKSEYLRLFLTSNIEIRSSILTTTWIEILTSEIDDCMYLPSILDRKEIDTFIKNNMELINKIRRLINSLPFYSISRYEDGIIPGIEEIPVINDVDIKLVNFYQLTEIGTFVLLLESDPIPERSPGYYKELFDDPNNEFYISQIMHNIPYFSIIETLFAPAEEQREFAKNFKGVFKSNIEEEV